MFAEGLYLRHKRILSALYLFHSSTPPPPKKTHRFFECTSLRRLNKTLYKDMLPYLSREILEFYTNSLRHYTNLIHKRKPKSTLNIIFILHFKRNNPYYQNQIINCFKYKLSSVCYVLELKFDNCRS